eukprot:TRINITY_DN55122_c0_g1_i1.p1 TRINITY_DN55122_c0_g1~~TRINITY_DN55122_c0_g1_i1.p1  ORF type:complete len:596 (-),score=57.41 TRINITY_DN55122_c0_g1_i1:500-2119(-)
MAAGPHPEFDVVVVGAGFAGLYALQRLRALGLRVKLFEAGSGVGGTWFWNRYPGARCDIESVEYSYQFDDQLAQEWSWSERFAAQPEILRYAEHVADRCGLYPYIQFNTCVTAATFEKPARWLIETASGETSCARYCIMALGCLSAPKIPAFPGMESFAGQTLHTGLWPSAGVDLGCKRVAVIGTGSSGVQVSTSLAQQVAELFVFQRTPSYVIPSHNRPLDEDLAAHVKARYAEFRAEAKTTANGHHPGPLRVGSKCALQVSDSERQKEYQRRWEHGGLSFLTCFMDLSTNFEANLTASDFVRDKIRSIVHDPATADLLCPLYSIGGKRLCVGSGYYEMFNDPRVHLVDASDGIQAITPNGVQVSGKQYDVDCIVFATGYDAFTGSLFRIDIRGKDGLPLKHKWKDGPSTFLGLATVGFPNMFMITGPGSPSVLTNVLQSIEQHVEWVADCIAYMRKNDLFFIEAKESAEREWTDHVEALARRFLRSSVKSWWNGADVVGKPQVFLPYTGGFPSYVHKCNEVAANSYDGFELSAEHLH